MKYLYKESVSHPPKFALRRISIFILLALTASVFNTFAQSVTLDRVVAVVDKGVIMQSQLEERMAATLARWREQQANGQLPPFDVLRDQVLENLIRQELQLQLANRFEIALSDEELDEYIEEMRLRNNHTEEEFLAQLASEGLSLQQLREQVHNQFKIEQLQFGAMRQRIDITEHDVDSFLSSKEGQVLTSPDYHLGHILIPVSGSATEAEVQSAWRHANIVVSELRNGADFAQMAITFSAGQNALEGGDLGWRKTEEMPALFAEQVVDLQKGDVTEPFRSGAGYHILKIKDMRGGGERLVEQSHVRHILLQPSAILTDEQAEAKLLEFREQILSGEADFAELAKEHSADIGTKQSGGDLGWSDPGIYWPQFEERINTAAIDDISLPFQTPDGWHILQVLERRQYDMSEEDKRRQAMNIIFQRRLEEELPIWLQELRDEAFVDIKFNEAVEFGNSGAAASSTDSGVIDTVQN